MSVQAMSWVIENASVGGSELLVLLMVANHAHADGTGAYPGEKLLAVETRMSERQVRRLLNQLVTKGAICIEAERSHLKTKVYRIAGMGPDKLSGQAPDEAPDRFVAAPDTGGSTPDKSVAKPDTTMSAKPFNRQKPSINRSTGERPAFDGRNLYRYHSELIGFASTPRQKNLIDKYVKWVDGDWSVVAKAMEMTENPRRTGWLGEVGDYVRAVAESRGTWRKAA